tara:strand:- start:16 stop:1155 length:1140 start_codon:yes stop_codon:yes gene_type:complete
MIKLKSLLLKDSRVIIAEGKLSMAVPSDIRSIHTLFKQNGYKLYVVGGAVRDAILGKSPKDFDLATDAKPDKVLDIARNGGYKTAEVGKSFGVVIVGGHEIATFRKDIGKGRRPTAVDYTDIKGDVMRRDLTINALFYDLDKKEIVDLVGGIKDLKKKRIRTVGKPDERFDEDPLRKLRAIRFAGSVGGRMDDSTYKAIKHNPSLKGVSAERIRDEFVKGLKKAQSPKKYLQLSREIGLLPLILPGFNVMTRFANTNDYIVQLANMLRVERLSLNRVQKGLKALKYQNQEIRDVVHLLKMYNFTPTDIYILKTEQKNTKLTAKQVKEWSQITGMGSAMMKIWNFKLSVKAKDVMKLGFKGKDIGDKMKELETNKFLGRK